MTVKFKMRSQDAKKIWEHTEKSAKPFSIYIDYSFVAEQPLLYRIVLAWEILTGGKFINTKK